VRPPRRVLLATDCSVTEETPPSRLELEPGEEREIPLTGLGTAGYTWEHELEGDSEAIEVTWRRGVPPGVEPPMPVGASAPEVATIRALRKGHATVHLVHRRPWEKDRPPRRSHKLDVSVT